MSDAAYRVWVGPMTDDYAQSFVDAGILTPDEAAERAARDIAEILPEGIDTPGQHLWTAWDGDAAVGTLWVAVRDGGPRPTAYVYLIEVSPEHRRRGHARAMMTWLAAWCRERDIASIGLNVFGHNLGAQRLYQELGFEATSISMKLAL